MWGVILIPFVFNLWFRKVLNAFEILAGVLHIVFFIVSIITLAVLGKRSSTDFVFKTLIYDESGWSNKGVCWGLGLLTVTFPVSGVDGVLHMSDEVKKVKTRAPRSIIIASASNALLLFAFVICLLFTIGDLNKVAGTPTGLPLIEVYYEATGSKSWTNVLVLMPAIIIVFSLFNAFASVSRLVWQFAKDNGLPFSKTLSYVHPQLKLPLNALAVVGFVSVLISIVYIISSTAFNAIISLQALALNLSYVPPIFFVMLRKIRGNPPNYGPFKIGRFGIAVNLFALAYLAYVITWMPFPQILPVTWTNFNYAGPLLGIVVIGALADWVIGGRKRFEVPVANRHRVT
jgi:amino acid transporter